MYCKYANGVIAYRRIGKRKYEKEPVLWCEKHKKSVLCTELHPCFVPERILPEKSIYAHGILLPTYNECMEG